MDQREHERFTSALEKLGVDNVPARKASRVLSYFANEIKIPNSCATQRINKIWYGMRIHNIPPLLIRQETYDIQLDLAGDRRCYWEIGSIQIGLDVCASRGLVTVMSPDTKYSISAKGMDFLETNS